MNLADTRTGGLLISRDLFFVSKVTGTANELGFHIVVDGNVTSAMSKVAASPPRCLILDLSTPGLTAAEIMKALPATNRPAVIAFDSHVLTARLQEARDAGCDEVMPRSKFSADLPEILTRCLRD